MFKRIVGVFQLNALTFEEIEHDEHATWQAALVVAIVAILVGLGGWFNSMFEIEGFAFNFLGVFFGAFIGWVLWSVISYFTGTALFRGEATIGEMLRVVGFASAPLALGIIPFIGGPVGAIWAMAAAFIAIRQGLDLDNVRAGFTMLIGFAIYIAAVFLLGFTWSGV